MYMYIYICLYILTRVALHLYTAHPYARACLLLKCHVSTWDHTLTLRWNVETYASMALASADFYPIWLPKKSYRNPQKSKNNSDIWHTCTPTVGQASAASKPSTTSTSRYAVNVSYLYVWVYVGIFSFLCICMGVCMFVSVCQRPAVPKPPTVSISGYEEAGVGHSCVFVCSFVCVCARTWSCVHVFVPVSVHVSVSVSMCFCTAAEERIYLFGYTLVEHMDATNHLHITYYRCTYSSMNMHTPVHAYVPAKSYAYAWNSIFLHFPESSSSAIIAHAHVTIHTYMRYRSHIYVTHRLRNQDELNSNRKHPCKIEKVSSAAPVSRHVPWTCFKHPPFTWNRDCPASPVIGTKCAYLVSFPRSWRLIKHEHSGQSLWDQLWRCAMTMRAQFACVADSRCPFAFMRSWVALFRTCQLTESRSRSRIIY